jgi:excisionase family DNA binding protein
MILRERLLTLRDTLPEGGSVVLTRAALDDRAALDEMLAHGPVEDTEGDRGPDYTVAEVAVRFDRSPQTVRDWIKSGKLRGYLFNGREYRVTRHALAEFEEKQRQGRAKPEPVATSDLGAWRRVSGL